MKKLVLFSLPLLLVTACGSGINVQFKQGQDRIEVYFGETLFTTYRHEADLTKPILFPVHSPSGVVLNRSFPFSEVEGERKDHPHHTGVFFTYDEVNEDGFWNNTTTPPQIKHAEVTEMAGGMNQGTLAVRLLWTGVSGETLLEEQRTMKFIPGEKQHIIDFDITLTALETPVTFHDTKEGMFAIRVAPWLREKGGSGQYLSSNADTTEKEVWGRRAKWVRLEGEIAGEKMGIAILNHPTSTNYPTYWHARGYGLFAANPLGQAVFQKTRGEQDPQPFNLVLQPDESAPFNFRMIFYEGARGVEDLDLEFARYEQQ